MAWTATVLLLHHLLHLTPLHDLQYSIKFFMPFMIYYGLKSVSMNIDWTAVLKSMYMLFIVYSIFIWISLFHGYRETTLRGYYGYVHGVNDLSIVYLILLPIIIYSKKKIFIVFYIATYLVTLSKGLVFAIPVFVFCLAFKSAINLRTVAIFFVFIAVILIPCGYIFWDYAYNQLFLPFVLPDMRQYKLTGLSYILDHREFLFQIVTFGRSNFLKDLISNLQYKSTIEYIIGSGLYKGYLLSGDKLGGIEMDLVDAFNLWGVMGTVIFVWFYYIKAFSRLKILTRISFLPGICYSIFGGHLIMNPLSNIIFVIIILIIENNAFSKDAYKTEGYLSERTLSRVYV